jgi:hypothetical protein
MPTVEQIMVALETTLDTIDGLRASAWVPGQINPPQAIVGAPPISNYNTAQGGSGIEIPMTVTVLTSAVYDRTGQMKLAGYASPTGDQSIRAAVMADRTLSGVVHDCLVDSFRPLGLEEVAFHQYFGGLFQLRVMA